MPGDGGLSLEWTRRGCKQSKQGYLETEALPNLVLHLGRRSGLFPGVHLPCARWTGDKVAGSPTAAGAEFEEEKENIYLCDTMTD
jgi:hypothetical protein